MRHSDRTRWLRYLVCGGGALMILVLVTREARAQQCCAASDSGPTGVWRGKWTSQSTGHQGPLGARIRPAGSDQYTAWFYGRFAKVIPFAYRASLTRVPGTADLYHSTKRMPLLGTYETTARISQGQFNANFVADQDRGVFIMSRRR